MHYSTTFTLLVTAAAIGPAWAQQAAALEDGAGDEATGGGGAGAGGAGGDGSGAGSAGTGGAGGDGDVRSWPDDDEEGEGQRRPRDAERTGAGSSTAGAPKRRAEGMFGSRPPKKAKPSSATKRLEATKAAVNKGPTRRAPKERPMVSG
jgi:hypothetical protein